MPITPMTLADIESSINIERDCGYVRVFEVHPPSTHHAADWLPAQLATHALNSSMNLHRITEVEAKEQFSFLMTHDMAHGLELMSVERAEYFWNEIASQRSESAYLLTNTKGMHNNGWAGAYDPATSSTFDSCLVLKEAQKAIIVVVEDED
jgi:hypothetical protein